MRAHTRTAETTPTPTPQPPPPCSPPDSGVPCLSLAVKDKSGRRIVCVGGAGSGTALDLRVEYASGVYTESKTVAGWFRSAIPTIAFISPSKASAGDTITIFGTGFGINPSVVKASVGAEECASTVLVSDILVECHLKASLRTASAVTVVVNGQSSLANPACSKQGGTETVGCVAPVGEAVTITLVLDMEFSSVGSDESAVRNDFISSLVSELAQATGASRTVFYVASVRAGSVVAEVVISDDLSAFAALSPANVAMKLREAVDQETSPAGSPAMTNVLLARTQSLLIPAIVEQLVEAQAKVRITYIYRSTYSRILLRYASVIACGYRLIPMGYQRKGRGFFRRNLDLRQHKSGAVYLLGGVSKQTSRFLRFLQPT